MADTLTVDKKDLEKKNDDVLFTLFGLEYTKTDAAIDAALLGVTTAATLGAGAPVAAGVSAVRFIGTQIFRGGVKAIARTAVKESAEVAGKAGMKAAVKEGAEAAGKAGVEAAAKTTGKESAEALAKKANAGLGERVKNTINNQFVESHWMTRNLLGKPAASIAGKAVSSPVKTIIAADLGVNAVSQAANPDDPNQGLMYNAAAATVSDASAFGRGTLNLAGGAVALVPGVGPAVAGWVKDNAPNAAKSLYEGAGQAVDGAMKQTAKEAGLGDIDTSSLSIPALPGAGIVARLGKSAHNAHVSAGKRGSSTAANELLNDGQGINSDATPDTDFISRAKEKASDMADDAEDGLNLPIEGMDLSNPGDIMNKMDAASKNNPLMKKMVDIGKAHPVVGLGIASGFGLGMMLGGLHSGSPKERAKAAFKQGIDMALFLGIVAFFAEMTLGPQKAMQLVQNMSHALTGKAKEGMELLKSSAAPKEAAPQPQLTPAPGNEDFSKGRAPAANKDQYPALNYG